MRLLPHLTLPCLAALLGCSEAERSAPLDELSHALLADAQTTLEEDFSYPGAEQYVARGITLKKGDGNLLLVECAGTDPAVRVETHTLDTFCFQVRGPSAYLTLELPEVFLIWTNKDRMTAYALVNGQQTAVALKKDQYVPVGYTASNPEGGAPLLELRMSP